MLHKAGGGFLLSRREARSIADRLLAGSKTDGCEIVLRGGREQNLRFANGGATTNRTAERLTLRIAAHARERVGVVEIASFDEAAGLRALAKAEEIAQALPRDPDYVPPLGPQRYARSNLYAEETAALGLDALASCAGLAIEAARVREVAGFGQVASGASFVARATSAGLFSYERQSAIELSTTARNRTDSWSGWAGAKTIQPAGLDAAAPATRPPGSTRRAISNRAPGRSSSSPRRQPSSPPGYSARSTPAPPTKDAATSREKGAAPGRASACSTRSSPCVPIPRIFLRRKARSVSRARRIASAPGSRRAGSFRSFSTAPTPRNAAQRPFPTPRAFKWREGPSQSRR